MKNFLIGAACGIAVGWFAQVMVGHHQLYSSEEVLKKVKAAIKKDGKITGSWIISKPEVIERNMITYQVYRGGITKLIANEQINIEFLADAKTGTILEIETL